MLVHIQAVKLRHDVNVKRTWHHAAAKRPLKLISFHPGRKSQHTEVFLFERTPIRQELKVLCLVVTVKEGKAAHGFHVSADKLLDGLEVFSDSPGSCVFVVAIDLLIGETVLGVIEGTNSLDQSVIDDRDDGTNTEVSNPDGCVNGMTRSHHGNVKCMILQGPTLTSE